MSLMGRERQFVVFGSGRSIAVSSRSPVGSRERLLHPSADLRDEPASDRSEAGPVSVARKIASGCNGSDTVSQPAPLNVCNQSSETDFDNAAGAAADVGGLNYRSRPSAVALIRPLMGALPHAVVPVCDLANCLRPFWWVTGTLRRNQCSRVKLGCDDSKG